MYILVVYKCEINLQVLSAAIELKKPVVDNDFAFEGCKGLRDHVKDVAKNVAKEIKIAGTNIGIVVGGLAANVAAQGLGKVYKVLDDGRNSLIGGLEKVQTLSTRGLNVASSAVTAPGDCVSRKLTVLVNVLDRVSQMVAARQKKKRSPKKPKKKTEAESEATETA